MENIDFYRVRQFLAEDRARRAQDGAAVESPIPLMMGTSVAMKHSGGTGMYTIIETCGAAPQVVNVTVRMDCDGYGVERGKWVVFIDGREAITFDDRGTIPSPADHGLNLLGYGVCPNWKSFVLPRGMKNFIEDIQRELIPPAMVTLEDAGQS